MDSQRIIDLFLFAIPSLIVGLIAYYFFKEHTKNEDGRRRYLLKKDMQTSALPNRLQAYERLTLFLERISIPSLVVRVAPTSADKNAYESLLIKNIENEFDHNLSQQIYLTDECWNVIKAAKGATIQMIRKAALSDADSADKLREDVLNETMDMQSPSNTALAFVKKEISDLW